MIFNMEELKITKERISMLVGTKVTNNKKI